jgi:hypothetical protein
VILPPPVDAQGDAINTTVWTLKTVPEGTMLTAALEIQFTGLLKPVQPVAEWQLRRALPEWMREFASYVEALQPS